MGYELLVSNPATSGSHSWKCLLASNTNDRAMTRLAYCGRREKFSTDVELANVFWKLWGSKKEYLDLPEGWSTPEIDQRFDMVCKAMQAGFDPFDYDEEEGEDEEESFEAQSVGYPGWKDCGCPASKMYVAGDYSRCFEIYCENCEEVEGSSRGMGHGNPGDALIAQICATQMRELLAARTFNPSIDGFRVLNHELLVSSSSSNYAESFEAQSETFASETCECGELEADDGEIYECNCCDEIFCIDCIENGDISACTIRTGDNPIADHPRIEETETGYMGPQGAICGECMSAIEYELDELPPIHEVIEEEQGTANFSMEGQVKKKGNLTELFFAGTIFGILTLAAMKRN